MKKYEDRTWLRDIRIKLNLTQKVIAEELKITRTYYSNIENGHKNPSLSLAIKISNFLNFDLENFKNLNT